MVEPKQVYLVVPLGGPSGIVTGRIRGPPLDLVIVLESYLKLDALSSIGKEGSIAGHAEGTLSSIFGDLEIFRVDSRRFSPLKLLISKI